MSKSKTKLKNCIDEFLTIRKIIKSCKNNEHINSSRTMCKTFFNKWKEQLEVGPTIPEPQEILNALFSILEEDIHEQMKEHYVR